MGHISNYARVIKAKLQDVFVCDQTDSNVTSTKSVTVEQIGDAICGEQVHATLETDDQTIIGGINENKDKVGDLTTLTTTDKSSLVGAVNEVNGKKIIAQALLSDTALTTTATDYNTVSNRKFSDYDLIVFKLGNSLTDTRRTVVLPSNIWSSGWTINEGVLHGSTASTPSSYQYSSFSMTYKSDTSITASVSGSATIAHLAIYGLKLIA